MEVIILKLQEVRAMMLGLDLDKIDEVRNKIPVLRDRRDDIYEL